MEEGPEGETATNSDAAAEEVEQAELEIWEIIQVLKGLAAGTAAPEPEEASRLQARLKELQKIVGAAQVTSVEQLFRRIDTDRSNSISYQEMTDYLQGCASSADLLQRTRALLGELSGSGGEMDLDGLTLLLRELIADEPAWASSAVDPTEADICQWLADGGLGGGRSGGGGGSGISS